ncbi:TolC family protein [Flavobacterium sp. '19STA2R22 D10 B1']|uniref:TolC family protein n=1 Tax=Flavobacterium aerium TaxID=3037261 RepID=UPI00278C3E08|nr:TolC family protein [Flavobacterium sp. '19STA2R22 D10 B1']
MKNIKIFSLVLFFGFTIHVSAQEVWTLQKCLETGMKNNLDFQLKQLDILSAEKTHRSPLLDLLPRVTFSGNQTYSIGSTIDPSTNNRVSSNIQSNNLSLNANMNLVDFNSFTQARRNKIAILKSKADKEVTANEYQLSILENYFNVLYSQELLKIQNVQFQNAQFNLNRIQKEVEIGSKPQSDLYDMQVSYAQEENNILSTKQLLENQKLTLLQLMNITTVLPNDFLVEPLATTEFPTVLSPKTIFEDALKNSPIIHSAELNEQIFKKNINIERNKSLPVLSAFYTFSSFYFLPISQSNAVVDPFWTQINSNKNHYIGIQLSVPLFNGLRNSQNVQLSKIEYQKKSVATKQEKIKLNNIITQEITKQEQNRVLVTQLENTEILAEKSFQTTQSKFTSGLVDATIFTTSKNQLITTQYNLLKAKFTVHYLSLKLNFLAHNKFTL